MDILLAVEGEDATAWRDAVSAALPEATLHLRNEDASAVDYVLAWRPVPEVFDRTRITKAIFNLGAGVDALLRVPTLPRDVPIYRLEDAGMSEQMAEYVTATVLRLYREFDAYAATQRNGRWVRRARLSKSEFGIGILGLGVLGRAIAGALAPFGFPVAGWSRTAKTLPDVTTFPGMDQLDPFLARSRVLVCLLPATPATRGVLDRARLEKLPRGAHLINVSRGDVIVDADLVALLDEGHLASATLDVFHEEPLPSEHPFWRHPKVTITPHISAVTLLDQSAAQIAGKIRALEAGRTPSGRVVVERGY